MLSSFAYSSHTTRHSGGIFFFVFIFGDHCCATNRIKLWMIAPVLCRTCLYRKLWWKFGSRKTKGACIHIIFSLLLYVALEESTETIWSRQHIMSSRLGTPTYFHWIFLFFKFPSYASQYVYMTYNSIAFVHIVDDHLFRPKLFSRIPLTFATKNAYTLHTWYSAASTIQYNVTLLGGEYGVHLYWKTCKTGLVGPTIIIIIYK